MPLEQIQRHINQRIVYHTSADQGSFGVPELSSDELAASIRTNAIIADHVYLSASHVFTSPVTFEAMEKCASLAECGSVIVGLRNDCNDFYDFANYVLDSPDYQEAGLTRDQIMERAKWLDALVTKVHRWQPLKSQPRFRQALISVLGNPQSLVRSRMTNTSEQELRSLVSRLTAMDPVNATRRNLLTLAQEFAPKDTAPIMREANLIYYAIGSTGSDLVPDLDALHFSDFHGGVRRAFAPPIGLSTPDAFNVVLDAFEISGSLMQRLTPDTLAKFLSDHPSLIRSFREKWWRTVDAATGQAVALGDSPSAEILDALKEAAHDETRKVHSYEKVALGITLSSLMLGAVALCSMTSPELGIFAYLVTLISACAEHPSIKGDISNGPFRLVSSRLATMSKVERARRCS